MYSISSQDFSILFIILKGKFSYLKVSFLSHLYCIFTETSGNPTRFGTSINEKWDLKNRGHLL